MGAGPLVGYYTGRDGELAGRWAAGGSMSVTVGAAVTPQQLTASLSAVDPGSGERLGRRYTPGGTYVDNLGVTRRRRKFSAYDVVYAPPKSISVAWALADPTTRKEVEAAWDRSVGAVVGFVQAEAVASRSGTNGVRREEVPAGATIARFDHWTSRAADPHVHAHLLVHNRGQCSDGKWRTLDGRLLYHNAAAASAVGGAVLRAELSRRLGWSWDRVGDSWHAELAGSPRRLIAQWSTRRRQIDRAAQAKIRRFETAQQREPTPAERAELWERAQRTTRPSKQDDPDPHTRWHSEAEALDIDPVALTASFETARRREPDGYDRAELVLSRARQAAPTAVADAVVAQLEQLGQASRGLGRPDILRTVWATLTAGAALAGQDIDVEAEMGRLAAALWDHATSRLVERDGRWYSTGLASAEVAAVSWLASTAPPAKGEADTDGLGGDQAAAVDTILNSATQGVLVLGPAGAGKTEMLSRVAGAVGADRVLAVAPTAEAAANLGEALDVVGETAARAALSDDQVPQGGWVIVDEAGQLDTRTLAALAGRAADADARMILVGDTAQQGSVGAGGVFQALADRPDLVPGAVLSELWRFCDRDEARATVGLRRGNVDSLAYHTERGRVHDSTEAELPAVAADWWAARRDHDTIITAPTRRLVADINSEIAALRHRAGETGEAVLGGGDTTIRVGDTVTTRRNNRRLVASDGGWIRNGDRWEVTGTTPNSQITARRVDRSATVTLPDRYTDEHVQLGYATTQTRVQSLTVDAALCAVTHASRRNQLYVGMTRGRAENHLLVVTDQPQHDEDTPPDHIIHTVMGRGGSHPLSVPAGSFTVTPEVAAAHLRRISDIPHRAPLPDLPNIDTRRILTHGPTAQTGGVEAEAVIGGAIGAWLDDDAEADEAARAWEDAMFDHIESGSDIADLIPAHTDPHGWIPDDDAGYDSLPPPDPDDYDPDTVTATPDQYPPSGPGASRSGDRAGDRPVGSRPLRALPDPRRRLGEHTTARPPQRSRPPRRSRGPLPTSPPRRRRPPRRPGRGPHDRSGRPHPERHPHPTHQPPAHPRGPALGQSGPRSPAGVAGGEVGAGPRRSRPSPQPATRPHPPRRSRPRRTLHPEIGERSDRNGHEQSVTGPGSRSCGSSATQHDFVIMVRGARNDAEALRDEVAAVLAPMGLRLSAAKTRVCHIDEGFELVGLAYPTSGPAEPNQQDGRLHLPIQEVTLFDRGQGPAVNQTSKTSNALRPATPTQPGAAGLVQLLPSRSIQKNLRLPRPLRPLRGWSDG